MHLVFAWIVRTVDRCDQRRLRRDKPVVGALAPERGRFFVSDLERESLK